VIIIIVIIIIFPSFSGETNLGAHEHIPGVQGSAASYGIVGSREEGDSPAGQEP
jgi:hypothetical protein